jgi:hypothetical protein
MTATYLKGQKATLRRTRMSGNSTLLNGFDYRTGKQAERTRKEWRADLRQILAEGGERRVHAGETWAVARKGGLQFEVYEVISA